MQLMVHHFLEKTLELPINYHHVLQSIVFHGMENCDGLSSFMHDEGYSFDKRKYKLFTFGPLTGRYTISEKNIIFYDEVSFEVRSIDSNMLRALSKEFADNGIKYLKHFIPKVDVKLVDKEVEDEEIRICMLSPVCVYSTQNGKTVYYAPHENEFALKLNENFKRKYFAYTGVEPDSDITLEIVSLHPKDKYVTKYKGIYINAWKGKYLLRGKRKYLDFLYQTGLGSKNSQGFGMFELM